MISWRKQPLFMILLYTTLLISYRAIGEEPTLQRTKDTGIVDGVVQHGEYNFSYEIDEIKLYLNWTQGKLYAALIVDTIGWVGIGFNSQKMNDADIIIGFVKDGETIFKEQVGVGRSHKDKDIPYMKSFAMKESGGKTTVEVELIENGVIKSGQKNLPLIIAFGDADSFSSYHKMKKSLNIPLMD